MATMTLVSKTVRLLYEGDHYIFVRVPKQQHLYDTCVSDVTGNL